MTENALIAIHISMLSFDIVETHCYILIPKGGTCIICEWGGVSSVCCYFTLLATGACVLLWYLRFCSIAEARVASCNVSLCLPVQVYDVNKLYGDIK